MRLFDFPRVFQPPINNCEWSTWYIFLTENSSRLDFFFFFGNKGCLFIGCTDLEHRVRFGIRCLVGRRRFCMVE
jgi:hypothetical protein